MNILLIGFLATGVFSGNSGHLLTPSRPLAHVQSTEDIAARYRRADEIGNGIINRVRNLSLTANWLPKGDLWVQRSLENGQSEFVRISVKSGVQAPLFNAELVSNALGAAGVKCEPTRLGISEVNLDPSEELVFFSKEGTKWTWNQKTNVLIKATDKSAKEPIPTRSRPRSNGAIVERATVKDGKVQLLSESGEVKFLSSETGFVRVTLSPDGENAIGYRVIQGQRRPIQLIESSPSVFSSRGVLKTRLYDQPGDILDTCEYVAFSLKTYSEKKFAIPPVNCGGQPWSGPPNVNWWKPTGMKEWVGVLDEDVRGYQQSRVHLLTPGTAEFKTIIDEKSETFIYSGAQKSHRMQKSPEMLWTSERTGWNHIYRVNAATGKAVPLTSGEWVVRDILDVDEESREIVFSANGKEAGDPYLIHLYKVKFDGSNLKRLTEGNGTHTVQWSPDKKFFVDTFSRVDSPPQHELRTRDGVLLSKLATADVTALTQAKIPTATPFTAKGRDGKTDIYGIYFKPSAFDPSVKYPVIEDIYAGPHDSHVPKAYRPLFWHQRLAELGFIVVQIDGMGTANRGKKFHDVCWQNLADAGFPDRIAWMKALAKEIPQMDLDRVGIYGTSAGGQNAAGAVLFHPEFYKVAVASCGCHDNRIDKYWWNEQWMGYPVGPHYEAQSNITNAKKLVGNLLLIVGELDTNVPPESTYRFADALIKAKKEFELVVLPGVDHTSGGAHGERKRRDFFVRHLLGLNPPNWNRGQ